MKKFSLFIIILSILTGCTNNKSIVETSQIVLETHKSIASLQNDTKIYVLNSNKNEFIPEIVLNTIDNTFSFSYDVLSSYLAVGTYIESQERLELITDDGKYHYVFDIVDESILKFNKDESSNVTLIDNRTGIELSNGAEFIMMTD